MTNASSTQSGAGFVERWLELLWKRRAWGAGVFLGLTLLAAGVVFLSRPVYRAEARLRLGEPPPTSGVSPNAGIVSFLRLGGDPFSNDLELLGSRSLAEAVVRDVALSARVEAPRGFYRDSVLTSLAVADSTIEARFEITWTDRSTIEVRRTSPTDSVVGVFATGVSVEFDGVRATFRDREPWAPDEIVIRSEPFGEAVRPIAGRLELTRTRREANVLLITYADPDPGVAQAVVESAVANFLALRSKLMETESGETVDSLRTVAAATERELRAAEEAVEELQRSAAIIAPDAQSEALIERYEGALAQLETARAELAALDTQLEHVAAAPDRLQSWTTLVAHPRFLESQTVGELLALLTELEGQRTELASRRTAGSREIQAVEAQIEQLDGALRNLASESRSALADQVDALAGRIAVMDAQIAEIPALVVELARRQRQARLLAELSIITEQRLRQEELRQALSYSNVQVIDPPKLRYRPIWPRKKLGLAVGLLIAGGAALFTVVVVERADPTIRTEEEIRTITDAPLLGTVESGKLDFAAVRAGADLLGMNGRITVAPVGASVDPGPVLELLRREGASDGVDVLSLDAFGEAASAKPGAVVLLVRRGRTRKAHLVRAVRTAREAGGTIVGTIVVGKGGAEVTPVWA